MASSTDEHRAPHAVRDARKRHNGNCDLFTKYIVVLKRQLLGLLRPFSGGPVFRPSAGTVSL